MYTNIRGLDKNLSDIYLTARGEDVVFCSSETLVYSRHVISEPIYPGFSDLCSCLKVKLIGIYVHDRFLAYRQHS